MAHFLDDWELDLYSGVPAYRQIVNRVQLAVATGVLAKGDQLPTIRALHLHLKINPNTVAKAYRELQHLGVIEAEHGSGCFVSSERPTPPTQSAALRRAKLESIASKIAADARREGIEFSELIKYLNQSPT